MIICSNWACFYASTQFLPDILLHGLHSPVGSVADHNPLARHSLVRAPPSPARMYLLSHRYTAPPPKVDLVITTSPLVGSMRGPQSRTGRGERRKHYNWHPGRRFLLTKSFKLASLCKSLIYFHKLDPHQTIFRHLCTFSSWNYRLVAPACILHHTNTQPRSQTRCRPMRPLLYLHH